MKKTYSNRLADLQSVLDDPLTPIKDYGFVIRQFLAKEALPIIKQKHKKQLLTDDLLKIITPKLKTVRYPSGSAPITDSYTLTLTVTRIVNEHQQILIKKESILLEEQDNNE